MLYNVILSTESNFPIRSRYVLYFMFSVLFKVLVLLVTFLLFQSNFTVESNFTVSYVVLALEKGPKNYVHRDLFKTKNPK